ncbi:MAG: F420-dependent NADP oxidoreductase [Lutibacter sp.]|nr:F420-dependent NADP oxidoreductase [Lutibacter sp.]MDT8418244.1 F420-dependent NADP oxidoreductase [Lutibacter sp.]
MIKIVILGGGNVAFHLTNALLQNDAVNVVQVYNRSLEKISCFKKNTSITNNLSELKDADIYILAVSDNVISEISSALNLKNKLVVHTSGSMAMDELKSTSKKGVFYILQTFSKERKIDFSTVPICIEAETDADLHLLESLAKSMSKNCYRINSNQRKSLHLAAVFVNNFVNHLYHIGHEICEQNKVPFEILLPLILETANKITTLPPLEAQTGPAKRHDTKTIEKHTAMLTKNQQEIYTLLTKSIYNTYGEKL